MKKNIVVGVLADSLTPSSDTMSCLEKFVKELSYPIIFKHLSPTLFFNPLDAQKNLKNIDLVYTRMSLSGDFKLYSRELEAALIIEIFGQKPLINRSCSDRLANDKFAQLVIAKKTGALMPRSAILDEGNLVDIVKLFKLPLIIKGNFGYGGAKVALAKSKDDLLKMLVCSQATAEILIAQEYLPLKTIKDYRVYIVDEKVVGGLIRTGRKGDFRANTALGGSREFFQPDIDLKQQALRIFKAFNLDIGSVDFLLYQGKYYFIEVNPSIAIKDKPVAEALFKLIQKKIKK